MANDPLFSARSLLADRTPELSLAPGIVLAGKYRLVRPAGFGGMGAVWVARNEATNAEVAVKVLQATSAGVDEETIARFRREAHAAAQLYHRGIVRIFDLVELDIREGNFAPRTLIPPNEDGDSAVRTSRRTGLPDALVMVMELLRGETLASKMDVQQRFSLDEALAIVLPLLSALAHAHAQGIVHRDLKPENVFLSVDPDGHVLPKILDFGISKLLQPSVPKITTDGAMLGTPSYMSPEQARGQSDVDARADVFACGILLYEMLAGENPFVSGSYHSVVAAILERQPTPIAGLPAEIWRVVQRCLEKPPPLRYADAAELSTALKRAASALGVPTTPGSPDASGAFPAPRGSFADASVPPAPFREPELTVPSFYVVKAQRTRARVWFGVALVISAIVGVAGVYTRTAHPATDRGTARPGVTATPPAMDTAAATIAAPAFPPAPAPPATTATSIPTTAYETPPSEGTSSAPAIPTVSSSAPSAATHARGASSAHSAGAHGKGSSVPPAPAPPANAAPPNAPNVAPSASAPKSSVVRDPGF
ncbi:MAG TPA: protein kinase [Polyangiaceae bacterium]